MGGTPPNGVVFKHPGAVHHARWKAKAIYNLKIFIFRDQFDLTKTEVRGVRQVCIFVMKFYIKAPNNDLMLMKSLLSYKTINSAVSKNASEKMANHLWYLSEELAGLALFDTNVLPEIKKKMVTAMKSRKRTVSNKKRFLINKKKLKTLLTKDLIDFVSNKSLVLFERFGLCTDFLDVDISLWSTVKSFQENSQFFSTLRIKLIIYH